MKSFLAFVTFKIQYAQWYLHAAYNVERRFCPHYSQEIEINLFYSSIVFFKLPEEIRLS